MFNRFYDGLPCSMFGFICLVFCMFNIIVLFCLVIFWTISVNVILLCLVSNHHNHILNKFKVNVNTWSVILASLPFYVFKNDVIFHGVCDGLHFLGSMMKSLPLLFFPGTTIIGLFENKTEAKWLKPAKVMMVASCAI